MGKKWDYDVPSVEVWKECLRVLKPGGTALVACGTRTQHRMAVNLEDAGFEIRDIVAWIYGCLSEDTEILTEKGFKPLHKAKLCGKIMIYDYQTNIYKWEKPKAWQMYNINEDTAYRIQSDYTDQIVSRNHRCLVEREGKLVFVQAEELSNVETMPYLPSDIFSLQKICGELLFSSVFWKSKRLVEKVFCEWKRKEVSEQGIENGKESSLERWTNLQKAKRQICRPINKVCSLSERIFRYGTKRWLCYGTPTTGSTTNKKTINEEGVCPPYQSRCNRQQNRKSDVIQNESRPQEIRVETGYKTTLATITPIKYTGMIFCPTVSTGAFVARRNGKVFITGNSGFPKSHNIGKAVDKLGGRCLGNEVAEIIKKKRLELGLSTIELAEKGKFYGNTNHGGTVSNWETGRGSITPEQFNKLIEILELNDNPIIENEREFLGKTTTNKTVYQKIGQENKSGEIDVTKGNSKYEGWGTALKPAMELWTLCIKPIEGTFAQNALKHGVSGLWIDGARVGGEPWVRDNTKGKAEMYEGWGMKPNVKENKTGGRFPANIILECICDEVIDGGEIGKETGYDWGESKQGNVPITKNIKSGVHYKDKINIHTNPNCPCYMLDEQSGELKSGSGIKNPKGGKKSTFRASVQDEGYYTQGDKGGASRFFYCAKSSKRERNANGAVSNIHPTCKPIKLLQYLVKLTRTPTGGTVLDCFAGSCSTAIACIREKRDFIMIEQDESYCDIGQKRIDNEPLTLL